MKKQIDANAAIKCAVTIPPMRFELTTTAPSRALKKTAMNPRIVYKKTLFLLLSNWGRLKKRALQMRSAEKGSKIRSIASCIFGAKRYCQL